MKAWPGSARLRRLIKARQGLARLEMAWHGLARLGEAWQGLARLGTARQGFARLGTAWQGSSRSTACRTRLYIIAVQAFSKGGKRARAEVIQSLLSWLLWTKWAMTSPSPRTLWWCMQFGCYTRLAAARGGVPGHRLFSEHRSIALPLIMKRCEGEGLNAWLE